MKTFVKKLSFWCAFLALIVAMPAHADTPSELHILPDGTFTARNILVTQKSGTSIFFSRIVWGNTFVRVTVLTHGDTIVTKNHGEAAVSNDIQERDILDITGKLSQSDGGLVVDAKQIRDNSLQVESKSLSGFIRSIAADRSSFVLPNAAFGNTTVTLLATTTIQKGARTIWPNDLLVGDKILATSGTYDYTTNILTASNISVYQDKALFIPRNFQGTLKSISGTVLPATLVVMVGSADYTVYLPAQASLMNKNRGAVGLARFVVGDTVRFFGSIRQTNLSEVDAILVRDLNF